MGIGNSLTTTESWPHQRRGSTIIKISKNVNVLLTTYPNGQPKVRMIFNLRAINETDVPVRFPPIRQQLRSDEVYLPPDAKAIRQQLDG